MKDAFRFSIRHLLLWTAAVGLFCLALKNASPTWFAASFALVLVLLAAGGLLVVFRRGAVQAWWIGFVACGGLYVVMLMYGWSSEGSNPLRPDRVATGRISRWTYEKVYPWIKADVPDSPADAFATAGGRDTFMVVTPQRPPPGPYQGDFVNVAHAFWTLLLAACGGERGALLGDLLCAVTNLLDGGVDLDLILDNLTDDELDALLDGVRDLLNAALDDILASAWWLSLTTAPEGP